MAGQVQALRAHPLCKGVRLPGTPGGTLEVSACIPTCVLSSVLSARMPERAALAGRARHGMPAHATPACLLPNLDCPCLPPRAPAACCLDFQALPTNPTSPPPINLPPPPHNPPSHIPALPLQLPTDGSGPAAAHGSPLPPPRLSGHRRHQQGPSQRRHPRVRRRACARGETRREA